jgi:hypothetical protein
MKKNIQRLKIGDIIEVPLLDGEKGFIQYLFNDKWGNLIGIFDFTLPLNRDVDIEQFSNKPFKFFPILTRIREGFVLSKTAERIEELKKYHIEPHAIFNEILTNPNRDFNWKIVGNKPVTDFIYPNFIWKEGGRSAKNTPTRWYLYTGEKNIELGKKLPEKYKSLEYMTSFPATSIINLIQNNHDDGRNIDRSMIEKSSSFFSFFQ